ncbi:fatty acid desaturase-domain-containing protein [Xylariales sp. PMI_506]|nr:fatty acid desaturase-domain-containing protein [Xylariales sp. PMI_506]
MSISTTCTTQDVTSTALPTLKVSKDRSFTIEEVHAANTPEKAWVAIRGHVYDITKLADKHPGGRDMLLLATGRDATSMYESMHTDKNTKVLSKYKIGKLQSSDVPQFAQKSEFSRTLEDRVLKYFKDRNIDPRHAPGMLGIYAFLSIMFGVSFLGMFAPHLITNVVGDKAGFILPWVAAAVNGWVSAMMGFYHCHDGCHGAFSRSPAVWSVLRRSYECFTGLSTLVWIHQHGLGHHPFTNVVGFDPDITLEEVRIHESQPWWSLYRWQKYYWLPLYSQVVLSRKLTEWKVLIFDGQFKDIAINPITTSEKIWAALTFSIYVAQHFLVPVFYFQVPIVRLLVLHAISDIVWSYYLTMIFLASHINDEVAWPQPDADGQIKEDWAKLQVEASLDFAHGDPITTFMCGSLNYQTVHHLFPYVCQWHYAALAPIVKQTCKEHGVRYNLKKDWWGMMMAHVTRINLFAENPTLR